MQLLGNCWKFSGSEDFERLQCEQPDGRMDLPNVRRPYHYRGISAPTGGGSPETFDLGMSISRVARNVRTRGLGTEKTLGPKEI